MNHFPFQCIDLTHALSSAVPSWEGGCGFSLETLHDDEAVNFRVQEMWLHCGIGTHIDAPAHCVPGGDTVDSLNVETLIAPCIVIDVSDKADASFELSVQDIECFERSHGVIADNVFVVIHTGWARLWNDSDSYRNEGCFPCISQEAAHYLLTKDIVGLGVDTLSPDKPGSDFPVHQCLLSHGKYLVENIAHANDLPAVGSFIAVMPIKIAHATEAPVRLIGFIPKKNHFALQQLIQLEKQVRGFGFDWPDIPTIIQQAQSECLEIEEVLSRQESSERLQEEISDLLHTAISLCLFAGFSVEETLSKVVEKFGGRMDKVKALAAQQGLSTLEGKSFEFMLTLWNEAKR